LIFWAILTAVIGFFFCGSAPYEFRTTHGDDGEFAAAAAANDDDDDDDDEVVAGRIDHKGKLGLENMCVAFAQIVIIVFISVFRYLYFIFKKPTSHL
jgi:hypothetical protein